MFYFKQISPIGCLLWTVLFVWIFIALKLYYVVGFLIFLAIVYNVISKAKNKYYERKEQKERDFQPEIGEVYKVCPYCGNDVKRSAKICPHCKNSL
ncbi:MAG: hypothetical protein ACI37Z_04010 [Candidatus Gastranaerophilaceae bacterium]